MMLKGVLSTLVASGMLWGGEPLEAVSPESLKAAYLDCERAALTRVLETAEIMQCSQIYELLKSRVFEGDWQPLRDWTERALRPGSGT